MANLVKLRDNHITEVSAALLRDDLAGAKKSLATMTQIIAAANRGRCLWCDPTSNRILAESADAAYRMLVEPGFSLAGSAIDVPHAVVIERVSADARYNADVDDPGGSPDAHWLGVAVRGNGGPLAILIAVRDPAGPPFTSEDAGRVVECAQMIAQTILPYTQLIATELEMTSRDGLFRKEARDYYSSGDRAVGTALRTSRALERWFYPLVIALGALAAILFFLFKRTMSGG